MAGIKGWLIRIGALALALWLAWRILLTGLAEHYVRQAQFGDEQAVDAALLWNSRHPRALYRKAVQTMESDPRQAEQWLKQSIQGDPANAAPYQALAQLLLKRQQAQQADALMKKAVVLMPSDTRVRMRAAAYWVEREQLQHALENWSAALVLKPELGKNIYPVLMQIADNPKLMGLFEPLLKQPPSWWDDFFTYVAGHSKKLNTVVMLASLRHAQGNGLSGVERKLLTERLMKSGNWGEAFLVWSNGLSQKDREYLGSIFDGGFELPPSNQGFGWYFPQDRGWLIRRKHTYGAEGERALHILYKGTSVPVAQIYQPLLLAPGQYVVRMLSRVDRLHTPGGLRWVIRCLGDEHRVLAEGPLLVGASDWASQHFSFEVPNERACTGQLLRLELTGGEMDKQVVDGEVWFDRMSIRKRR